MHSIKTGACIHAKREREPDPFSLHEIFSLEFKHDWRLLFLQRGSLPQGVGFLCERVFKIKGHAVGITQFMIHIIKNSIEKGHTVTYLPYSVHLGKKINVQSHSKVRSPQGGVQMCVNIVNIT